MELEEERLSQKEKRRRSRSHRSAIAQDLRESGKYRIRRVETKKKINLRPNSKEIMESEDD